MAILDSPKMGFRGFKLAQWGLWFGWYIVTLAFVALFFDKLTGGEFINGIIGGVVVGGAGGVGQYASNFAERWRITPKEDSK